MPGQPLFVGRPVLVVVDPQRCGEQRHEAALDAMEYPQAGARRTTDEIISAFAASPTPTEPIGV